MAQDFYQDVNYQDQSIIILKQNEKMETWHLQQVTRKMVMPAEEDDPHTDFQDLPYQIVAPKHQISPHQKVFSEGEFEMKKGLPVQQRKILRNVKIRLPEQDAGVNKGGHKIVAEEPQLVASPQSPGSSPDLDLKGKKKLEPQEGRNDDLFVPADSKVFDLRTKPALKRHRQDTCDHLAHDFERILRPEQQKVNTKQEANVMIQKINAYAKQGHLGQLPPQALTFDVNLNRRKLCFKGEIGSGSFGKVSLYTHGNQDVVLKKLPPRDKRSLIEPNEVLVPLEFAKTGLFPKVLGLEWNSVEAVIIQEYAGESLAHRLGDPEFCKRLYKDEEFGVRIMLQVFQGQAELHKMGVVHRDYKIENITMNASEKVFTIDFGSARTLQDQLIPETYAGSTPECLPPIVSHNIVNKVPLAERAPLNAASDVWGGGMIAAALLRNGHPMILHFVGQTNYPDPDQRMPTLAKLAELGDPLPESILSHPNHPILEKLIRGCLIVDEQFRWTAQEAVNFLQDKLNQNRCDLEPRCKKVRRLNERDKQEMQAHLARSGFNKVEVPDYNYQILGIQKRTAVDGGFIAAEPQQLNIIPKVMASPRPPPVAAPSPPQRMFSGHRKILPKPAPQAIVVRSQSSNLQVEQDDLKELENFFYQKKPMLQAVQQNFGAYPFAGQTAAPPSYQNCFGIPSSSFVPSSARPMEASTFTNYASTSGGRVILQASPSPPIAAPTSTPPFNPTQAEEAGGNIPNFLLM